MTTSQGNGRGGADSRTQPGAVPTGERPARHHAGQASPVTEATLRAADSVAWTEPVATPSATAILSAAGTVTQGRVVARETGHLARELLRIAKGSSSVAAPKGD